MNAFELARKYDMKPHEENGCYSECHYSYDGEGRAPSGSSYFYTAPGERTLFHKIDCDEYWCFNAGSALEVWMIGLDGKLAIRRLGVGDDAELDAEPGVELEVESGAELEARIGAELEARIGAELEAESDAELEAAPGAEPEARPGAEPGGELDAEPMLYFPRGVIFASRNTEPDGKGTFFTCITIPRFSYDGFQIIEKADVVALCPDAAKFWE